MIHDERISCTECGSSFTIPKSRRSLVIGLEYVMLLGSVALSIQMRSLLPTGLLLVLLAVVRYFILPKMMIEHKRTLNRLRKFRRK